MVSRDRIEAHTGLIRLGFTRIAEVLGELDELAELTGTDRDAIVEASVGAADPNEALRSLNRIARADAPGVAAVLADERVGATAWRLLGASRGFGEFFVRRPASLEVLIGAGVALPTPDEMAAALTRAVGGAPAGFAGTCDESAWVALRVAYREQLARIAAFDLLAEEPLAVVADVSLALSDLAAAAVEASLAVARAQLVSGTGGAGRFPQADVEATQLSVIGMGKTGARELNYVSDVDVIFVADAAEGADIAESRMLDIATRLARQTIRGISGFETEPPLWEVDANLRPEGKKGALVRTLASHVAYYDRWAENWEFQALLKARPLAGDAALGEAYIAAVWPHVWESSGRDGFVSGVQRMRQRVEEHIPQDEADRQLKLGSGGLRDIEFAVQLLQLVHGRMDDAIRQRGTLEALDALADQAYISRDDAAAFAADYRVLRLWEHRLQMQGLSRTHLMPADDDGRRVLARASGFGSAGELTAEWARVRRDVRDIHVRIFYRPLLGAVAALGDDEVRLSPTSARARLAAIGFRDPDGSLRHLQALTQGISRKAQILRHIAPVMLRWFADGADPDYGLLTFRKLSESVGSTSWFLRVLRDAAGAAEKLTKLLSGSRFVCDLMDMIPESVAWLESDQKLRPRTAAQIDGEARAIQARHATIESAMKAVRAMRRRELLRAAMASMLGVITMPELSAALTAITEATIQATLRAVVREVVPEEDESLDFAIIGMGRLGGAEVGFGSDADILYVYRPEAVDPQRAQKLAERIVAEFRRVVEDARVPLELDAELRPEGKKGPIVRSLEAYRAYYSRWSLSWEAQALLRARGIAGSAKLIDAFMEMADEVRYPEEPSEQGLREIRLIKARVEGERLPQGVDPKRHLKLGPGALSDVEWLVQLLQLQHAHRVEGMRTTSTLGALAAAEADGLVDDDAAVRFREAWLLATRLRSANTLLTGRSSDVLPTDAGELDAIARILDYDAGSAMELEEDWARTSRRARYAFERLFYDA
ncbi:bifunctional [glutamine synthetase] adenylyltransferase/[glutamine synthetase]-adenylyl-L-tyrosine phosphorylase [Microbacterium halophytorum]|uniref:bifunctional [glutamine synthetase] adenylyltransferase/[glutamine synthetase]-adenylyl-L-tyrosine phosphorylase n=1 Tax=Microbacterium halophytorum TaxID=2067568 RepID=UPI000CFBD0C7|nr:bifunctional [glutamine synthetase] adenylyltransferase/[glutamine synthetase]-adenylyl-L-tyrosine phosphorylase [Microbacterium halophytorum]